MIVQNSPGAATVSLSEWASVVGAEHVTNNPTARAEAQTATFATTQTIQAIVRPGNVSEVQTCLRLASRTGCPVYPISSGKNWGYGSKVPPQDRSVLLDLGRLNRILDFNEELAYVTVEPGVTQRQLWEFLQDRKSRLWMDATGSSPDCSLIGNAMERGFGHTPYGDHIAHVCGLEVVLPTGELIETGFARLEGARVAPLHRWGLGPSLDGLFSQSNLGIVTRMTIWLMPAPAAFEAFFLRCDRFEDIVPAIDIIRRLRLEDVLKSSIHIGNDYKVLNGLQQFPWSECPQPPLGREQMVEFRKKLSIGSWNVSGALYGTPAQVAESKRILRSRWRGQPGKLRFLNPQTLATARRFARPFKLLTGWDIEKTATLVEPVLGLMCGKPTTQSLGSAYWRKRMPIPNDHDPGRDACGLLWHAPVAPAEGREVLRLTSLASDILLKHGFEPMISLTVLTPRTVSCVISISYDRALAEEDERAQACYRELVASCDAEGYYSYRLGINAMNQGADESSYGHALGRIRAALDPKKILAPKRYA